MLVNQPLHRTIESHPALVGKGVADRLGLSLPNFPYPPLDIVISEETRPMLSAMGVTIEGSPGLNNIITLDRNMVPVKLTIRINNKRDNRIIIENDSCLEGVIHFEGNGHLFVCGAGAGKTFAINAMIRQHSSAVVLGRGSTAGSRINLWVEGPETVLAIGDDCLFSWGIWVRCADSHGIIDIAQRKLINMPKDIEIGSHSWIGQDAIIMKGVTIGAGSIVAARAIVTKSCSPCSLVAGVPAKLLREGVSWTRQAEPNDEQIDSVIDHVQRIVAMTQEPDDG